MATSCDPKTLTYNYCRTVLQQRWVVECNDGCRNAPEKGAPYEGWDDMGLIDPIKAILIINE